MFDFSLFLFPGIGHAQAYLDFFYLTLDKSDSSGVQRHEPEQSGRTRLVHGQEGTDTANSLHYNDKQTSNKDLVFFTTNPHHDRAC